MRKKSEMSDESMKVDYLFNSKCKTKSRKNQ